MNRLLLVMTALFAMNALLLLFVTFRLCEGRVEAAGKEEGPTAAWTTADLRVVQGAPDREDKRVRQVTLDLGTELAEIAANDGGEELGLRVEPEVEALCSVRPGGRQIDVAFPNGLQPGRRHHLHLGKTLRDRHGRELTGAAVAFATPTVELGRVVLEESEAPDVPPTLLASFDMPVDVAALRELVRVVRVDTGASVPAKVEEVAHPDEYLFRIVPELAAGSVQRIALILLPGLRPRGGDVGIEREQMRLFALREALQFVSAEASEGAIDLHFNRSVGMPAPGMIALAPAIPFHVFQRGTGLRLTGTFAAGSTVAVQVAAGFPGTGRGLLQPARWSVLFPELQPSLDFARRGNVLSARAEPVLEVRCVNVEQFRLRVRRVYPNNVVRMVQRSDNESMAPAPVRTFAVKGPRNQAVVHRVDLREVLGPDARGFHLLELWNEGQSWPRQRLVQITDLGVTVRAAGGTAAVQVVSIAEGSAVAAADVQVLSPTNQVLAAGRTDERGAVLLQWSAGADRAPFLVRAKSNGDEACVDFGNHGVELSDPALGGRPYASTVEAYVWPVRGIVRPGERVEAGVLLRDPACATVAGRELTVSFVSPNGRTFRRQQLTTPGSGLVTAVMETSTDVPAGSWQINVREGEEGPEVGTATVQVEAFVPYRIEADVTSVAPLHFGGACTARISGRWLDGTPAGGLPVTLRVRLAPGQFKPLCAAGFTFARGDHQPPPGELPEVRGVLGADGRAELTLALPADAAQQTLTAVLVAEVLDPSGRPVRAASEVPVLRKDLHLGVRATNNGVDLCAVGPAGALLGGEIPATVRLERRSWHQEQEAVGEARWRWRTSVQGAVLGEWPAVLREGKASVPLDLAGKHGWLAVVVTAGGVSVEQDVGEVPLRPDRLRVEGPAAPVLAGTTVRIVVDAPSAGRAFVTLEGPSVLSANVVDLLRGRNEVFVAIPEGVAVPNLHAVVTLTRALREVGPGAGPSWLVGGTSLTLQRDEVRGAVTVQVPAQVLPGSTVQCEVLAPGSSSALVAFVDEGVLAVTGHRAPDPAAFFLARRRLQTAGADGSAALMEGAVFVAGTRTGGGDDGGDPMSVGSVSPRIRPLAMCSELKLDAEGRGTVTFTLPEYEGRVRAMVLAAGPRTFGAAAASTIVQAPCGLQVAMPRMVAPGDRFAAVVSLRNGTGTAGEVELRCTAEGLQAEEGTTASIPLAAGATSHHLVWLRALEPMPGKAAVLRVEARLGKERRQVSALLHVRELRLPVVEHMALRLGSPQELRIGESFQGEELRAVIDLDGGPDRQLRPGLEAMLQYPYGCVEQTTSRGFAVLACQALLDRIYGPEQAPPQAAHLVQSAVDRLAGMQNWRGGFGWWPGDREEFPFSTLYAVDFLASAREAGCRVPDAVLQTGLQRVQQIATSEASVALRCLACEVLSRSGGAVKSRVVWLASQVREPEDRALLALALCRFGERERAREVLEGAKGEVAEAAWSAGGRDMTGLRSPLRTRALRLRALMALDPADKRVPELAFALQREVLQPDRLSTQELGQALRALATYCSTMGARGRSQVIGTVDGVPLPQAAGGRIEFTLRPGSVLSLAPGGSGMALLSVHGMRAPAATSPGVLQVTRKLVDPETGKEATELRSGRVYEVRLEGKAQRALEQVVLVDLLPGGLEPEAAPPGARPSWRRTGERGTAVRIETRDDRVLLFPQGRFLGEFSITYLVRAALPGTYCSQPLVAQAMYDPEAKFTSARPADVVVLP